MRKGGRGAKGGAGMERGNWYFRFRNLRGLCGGQLGHGLPSCFYVISGGLTF